MVYRLKPGLHCDISISINISITNVHTCCMLNEAVGVWDEARFKNGGARSSPAAFAALQMPDTFVPRIFLSRDGCINL